MADNIPTEPGYYWHREYLDTNSTPITFRNWQVLRVRESNRYLYVLLDDGNPQSRVPVGSLGGEWTERIPDPEEAEGLKAELRAARAQIPETMQDCTILFRQCPVGHGWLTAANWIQHGCPTCERDALRAALPVPSSDRLAEKFAVALLQREDSDTSDFYPLLDRAFRCAEAFCNVRAEREKQQ